MKNIYMPSIALLVILSIYGCNPDNLLNNNDCSTLHQGYIKVINDYNQTIRVYIDESSITSNNYDLLIPSNQIRLYTTNPGTHNYTITDELGIVLDQAQLAINNDCDSITITKTGTGGGGGGGGNNPCTSGNWGIIKVQNTYNQAIRVYIDQTLINSYNYNLLIPTGQTRYLYNMSLGPHFYTINDELQQTLDQAQICINSPCDSALISRNVPLNNPSSNAMGCSANNWGIIKITNIYNQNIRVYIDNTSINSYNYDILIPAGQTRFYYSAYAGKHDFIISDELSVVLDKAQVYVNNSCDTCVVGLALDNGVAGAINGCLGASWGVVKVVNNRYEPLNIYLNNNSPNSYNYNMKIPAHSTRYYYNIYTGATSYEARTELFVPIDQAQINISQDCETAVIVIN